jgi:hypothetical protein
VTESSGGDGHWILPAGSAGGSATLWRDTPASEAGYRIVSPFTSRVPFVFLGTVKMIDIEYPARLINGPWYRTVRLVNPEALCQ